MNIQIHINKCVGAVVSVLFLGFIMFILPWVSNYSREMTGSSESVDTSFIYTADELYDIAEIYGEDGRASYILLRWTFDVVWPLVYGMFLYVWMTFLVRRLHHPWVKKVRYIVVCGVLFDFLENIGATIVMARYPESSGLIAEITPYFTLIKWVFVYGAFICLFALLLITVYYKIKKGH